MSSRLQSSLLDSIAPTVRSAIESAPTTRPPTRARRPTAAPWHRDARVTYCAFVCALAGALLFGSSAGAQEGMPRAAVMGGARVRVTYPGIRRRVGRLVSIDRDTLVARWESGVTSRMALGRVTELDISMGRFPRPVHGSRVGGAIGLAGGLIVSLATGRGADVTLGCGAVGALVGFGVGMVRPGDTWRPVERAEPRPGRGAYLPGRVGVASSP